MKVTEGKGRLAVGRQELLAPAYSARGRRKELAGLLKRHPGLLPDSRHESLVIARAFQGAPVERTQLPRLPVRVGMTPILTGQPEISVKVNGRPFPFVVDTGPGISVLTKEVAEACGVQPIGDAVGYARTSTSKRVAFRPAVIHKLAIGDCVIENHPVVIVDSSDLSFGVAGLTLIRIQGIIGWPALRNVALTLDYGGGEATIARSEGRNDSDINLIWLGYPMVRFMSFGGVPLYFGLDTGAQKSSLKARGIERLGIESESTSDRAQGAGGAELRHVREARDVVVYLDRYRLTFDKIKTGGGMKSALVVAPDGKLWINSALHGGIRIDYPVGRVTLLGAQCSR